MTEKTTTTNIIMMMIHSNFFVIFVLLKNEGRKEQYHLKKKIKRFFKIKKSDSMMETIITGEGKTTRQNQKRSFVIFHFSVS